MNGPLDPFSNSFVGGIVIENIAQSIRIGKAAMDLFSDDYEEYDPDEDCYDDYEDDEY